MRTSKLVLITITLMMLMVGTVAAAGITGVSGKGVDVSKTFMGPIEYRIQMKAMYNYDFGNNILCMTNASTVRFYDLTIYNKPKLVKEDKVGARIIGRFNKKLYVTNLKTIWAYNVASPSTITRYGTSPNMAYIVGSQVKICDSKGVVKYTYSYSGLKNDLVVKNNVLYLPVGDLIKIIDISNAASPKVITNLKPGASCIEANNNYLFIGETRGITVVDISTPSKPRVIGNYLSPNGKPVTAMVLQDSFLAVSCSGTSYGYTVSSAGKLTKI